MEAVKESLGCRRVVVCTESRGCRRGSAQNAGCPAPLFAAAATTEQRACLQPLSAPPAHTPARPPPPCPPPGIVAQHNAQPGSPLEQLSAHLADPWKNHFINNGVSLPFLTDRCAALACCAHQLLVSVLASSALSTDRCARAGPGCSRRRVQPLQSEACMLATGCTAASSQPHRCLPDQCRAATLHHQPDLGLPPPPSHPLQRAQPAGRQLLSSPLQPDAALSCG